MKALLSVFAILAVLFEGHAMPDPCQPGHYLELNDVRRSTGYRMVKDEPGLCDIDLEPGWYRFTGGAGGMMPEQCLHRTQCGTLVPVWLNGSHPTVADGAVNMIACANFGSNEGFTPCCDHHIDIGVKNCGAFFVYYLQSTPSCPVAYCAGTRAPCPAGYWSNTGFSPCVETYPIIHTSPTLIGPTIHTHSFNFACRIDYPQHDPDLRFEVQWTFDNETDAKIPNMLLTDPDREISLPGTSLAGHMNHLLGCRVRAWYANRGVTHKSPWHTSQQSYYVGIKIDPGRVDIDKQTQEAKVTLTSTVPIVCDHSFIAACCISLNLDVDGPKNTMVVPHPCTYKLCTKDWDPNTNEARKEITIAAKQNQIIDGSRPMRLAFETVVAAGGGAYLNVFSNYTLPEVSVTAHQSQPLKCRWTGDPHITGFSGKRFHLFDAGDFTMYKNDHDNFEIQSRTYVCGRVACQCGLLIKEQNDVIHINNCEDMRHAPVVETTHPLREGTVVERSSDGKNIMVYLPSGREVKVDVGGHYHNVYLTVPASDARRGGGRGICGTPDGSLDNEFTYSNGTVERNPCTNSRHCVPAPFEESWRHNTTESLFHALPPTSQTPTESPHYCQCDAGVTGPPRINCSVAAHVAHMQRCSPCTPVTNLPAFLAHPAWSTTRRDVDEEEDYKPVPPHLSRRSVTDRWGLTWPTSTGITETQANTRCQAAIQNAQLFSHCQTDARLLQENLENCMLDVLFTGNFKMLESSLEAFTDGCQFELIKDIKNYDHDMEGNLVLKSHVTNVCTSSCFLKGHCVDGKCVCNPGFTGSSCQLEVGVPPTLLKVVSSNPCDANKGDCQKIYMDAVGFESGENFKCKSQRILADGSLGNAYVAQAEFITDRQLACPFPDPRLYAINAVKTFTVSVTTDGANYSAPLNVTAFDSTCMDCDSTGCAKKPDTCLIHYLCHRRGDVNPENKNHVCDPSQSQYQWTAKVPEVTDVTLADPMTT